MKIKEITGQNRRDFWAIYECQHCGATEKLSGYDDANFHNNVIPKIPCALCGKNGGDYTPMATKYAEGVQV